ncbi:hypothetical protein B0H11DRAFT_2093520 [Mycena galericulata]|nr:hypothetical protein B0H11DRAFT_2093520 [Mycena galericulata]
MKTYLHPLLRVRARWARTKIQQWKEGRKLRFTSLKRRMGLSLRRVPCGIYDQPVGTPSPSIGSTKSTRSMDSPRETSDIPPWAETARDSDKEISFDFSSSAFTIDSPSSVDSFGTIVRPGCDDPFGYGDPRSHSDDDQSSFDSLDDCFSDSEVEDAFSFSCQGREESLESITDTDPQLPTRPVLGEKMFAIFNVDELRDGGSMDWSSHSFNGGSEHRNTLSSGLYSM